MCVCVYGRGGDSGSTVLVCELHVALCATSCAELYIDEKKKCYEDLGYKRFNFVSIWAALVSAISRRTLSNVSNIA